MSKRNKLKRQFGASPKNLSASPTDKAGFYLPAPQDLAFSVEKILSVGGSRPSLPDVSEYLDDSFEPAPENLEADLLLQFRFSIELLSLLSAQDRVQLIQSSLPTLPSARRRDLMHLMAEILQISEKDVQVMAPEELTRQIARYWYALPPEAFCGITVGGVRAQCGPSVRKFLDSLTDDFLENEVSLSKHQGNVPAVLWHYAVRMLAEILDAPDEKLDMAIETVTPCLRLSGYPLPFQARSRLKLNPLEDHIYQLHKTDSARAKLLLSSFIELTPARAHSWLLVGLTRCEIERPPNDHLERAWLLCGRLFAFSNDPATLDQRFQFENLHDQEEVFRTIIEDPRLAEGKDLVGEYLLAQIYFQDPLLFLDLLQPELVKKYPFILLMPLMQHSQELANRGDIDRIQRVIKIHPTLRTLGIMARVLRRGGRFDDALGELDAIKSKNQAERALCEARIDSLKSLQLPEDLAAQRQLSEKLARLARLASDALVIDEEARICAAIANVLTGTAAAAEKAYPDLADTWELGVDHFALLAALNSQNSEIISECIDQTSPDEMTSLLEQLPKSLLRPAARKLLALENPLIALPFINALYTRDPEALEPLLGNSRLLAASSGVLRRQLDSIDHLATTNQKWFALQVALEHARNQNNPELVDLITDACLEFKDPIFLPFRVQLLQQQIAAATSDEDRELFIEHLCELSLQDAKPHLYQLLKAYLGKTQFEAAEDILETLELAGESPGQLAEYRKAIPSNWVESAAAIEPSLPKPARVLFIGGTESDRPRTEQIRSELQGQYSGLEINFDLTAWKARNLSGLLAEVPKFDVIIASPLMRTTTYRRLHRKASDLEKTFATCRGRGTASIKTSILHAVNRHFEKKNGN